MANTARNEETAAQKRAEIADTSERRVVGRPFAPGNRANPAGRPKGLARVVRETLGDDGETIVMFLSAVMAGGPLPDGRKPSVRESVEAGKLLMERGWGKAPQFAPIDDPDPLEMGGDAGKLAVDFEEELDELARRRRSRGDAAAAG